LIAVMIPIAVLKSRSDYEMKIADRFWDRNRWSIFKWKSGSDFAFRLYSWAWNRFSIADRFENEKRWSILIRNSQIDFKIKIDHRFFRNDFHSRSWSRLQF